MVVFTQEFCTQHRAVTDINDNLLINRKYRKDTFK